MDIGDILHGIYEKWTGFDGFMDLTDSGRWLKCRYHGRKDPHLEARIFEQQGDNLIVGITLSPKEIARHEYDPKRRSLEVRYRENPDARPVMGMHFERFTVPKEIKAIHVYDA